MERPTAAATEGRRPMASNSIIFVQVHKNMLSDGRSCLSTDQIGILSQKDASVALSACQTSQAHHFPSDEQGRGENGKEVGNGHGE